jgi:EmrB/QacA subfamily drug resistance transporter
VNRHIPHPLAPAKGTGEAQAPAPRRWLALAVLCVSLLIVTLDNTILNVVLPTLVRDMHATSTQLQWVVDSYALVFGCLLLSAGSVADRVGRKVTLLAGLIAFASGSAWAAFSGSTGMLIAARASMGVGAALIMPSTLAILTSMFTEHKERQLAIGLWSGTSGLGIGLGPIVGGVLLAHYWWGSVFLINVPLAAVGLAFALPLVPGSKNPAAKPADPVGAALSMAGLALLLWALIEAPGHGWSSALVLGTGTGGLAVLALFGGWEWTCSHPMLDLRFFQRRRFTVAISAVGLVMFGLLGSLFLLTQFLQFQLGYTPLQAGVRVLPMAGGIAIVAPLSTAAVRVAGPKLTVSTGLLLIAGGLWQISAASVSTGYTGTLAGMILIGIGTGMVLPSATESVMGSLPSGDTGVGSATNSTFLQIGGALGVAVIGSLLTTRFQGLMTPPLAHLRLPAPIENTILGGIGEALGVAQRAGGTAGSLLSALARSAFISGMDLGLLTAAVVVLGAAMLTLCLLPGRGGAQRR